MVTRENVVLILGIAVIGATSFYISPWWLLALIAMPFFYIALRWAAISRRDSKADRHS